LEPPAEEEVSPDDATSPPRTVRSNLLQALPNLRANPGALRHAPLRFRGLRPAVAPTPSNEN
jgi:hypothetical protein